MPLLAPTMSFPSPSPGHQPIGPGGASAEADSRREADSCREADSRRATRRDNMNPIRTANPAIKLNHRTQLRFAVGEIISFIIPSILGFRLHSFAEGSSLALFS